MNKKRITLTVILLLGMIAVGLATIPDTELFTKQFWLWLTLLLFSTMVIANLLGEEQYQLFEHIDWENFKNAPIFGILFFPLLISTIVLIILGIKAFIIDAIK